MGVTEEVVAGVIVVVSVAQPAISVLSADVSPHEFMAGMLHTNLLSLLQLLSNQVPLLCLIFKTQFSMLVPLGSPLCQL